MPRDLVNLALAPSFAPRARFRPHHILYGRIPLRRQKLHRSNNPEAALRPQKFNPKKLPALFRLRNRIFLVQRIVNRPGQHHALQRTVHPHAESRLRAGANRRQHPHYTKAILLHLLFQQIVQLQRIHGVKLMGSLQLYLLSSPHIHPAPLSPIAIANV